MVTKIRQGDNRWSAVRIGDSNVTVGGYGCTTCAMCMCLEKLRGYFCNPGEAAKHWTYNERGEILWYETEWKGMKFLKRGYGNNVTEIANHANADNTGVILSVNNNSHWVYCHRSVNGEVSIIDPIDGKYYKSLPTKYTIAGYATFEKDEVVSDWAIDDWKWATDLGLMDGTNPQGTVTREALAVVLKRFNDSLT